MSVKVVSRVEGPIRSSLVGFLLFNLTMIATHQLCAQEKGKVALRITLSRTAVCQRTPYLEVEAELRNVSLTALRLSTVGLGASISFTNVPGSLEDGFRSSHTNVDPLSTLRETRSRIVTIGVGGSKRETLRIPLDQDFFTPGVYRLTVGYSGTFGDRSSKGRAIGWTDSNEILFEIEECKSSAGGEPSPETSRHPPRKP